MGNIATALAKIQKKSGVKKTAAVTHKTSVVESDEDDVPVGIHGVLASTEKLLAINKGLIEPDERDSLQFKKFFTPDKLLRERVRLDNGKIRQTMLRHAAKSKSLRGVTPFLFDAYATGGFVGNQLSSPLEEINPLQLHEQANRSTQMGQGGIGSSEALTSEMTSVQPSTFGFIDPIAGPESELAGVDVRYAHGVKLGSDGMLYQKFRERRTGKLKWLNPREASEHRVKFPD